MNSEKMIEIQRIVDSNIRKFAEKLEVKHISQVTNPEGVINSKKKNFFMAELGEDLMFYSAFVRSFDSSFGQVLEKIGKSIATLSYEVRGNVDSFLLTQQSQQINYMLEGYDKGNEPSIDDYNNSTWMNVENTSSFDQTHITDHYFYNPKTNEHSLIELKAGGDLDIKKARSEKHALLEEYYILKNSLLTIEKSPKIKLYFGTAYNKFGEGEYWKQHSVRQYFAKEELLVGKDYWNFVCDSDDGFEVVKEQYKISTKHIEDALSSIKSAYFD